MDRPVCVMLVAGEASGDVLGAELARALKARLGEGRVRFVGVGGPAMAAEGVESPFDIGQLSVFGLFEGVKAYPRVKARVADTAALAGRERPDIAVLIDSWGFTLRVAQALRAQDPKLPLVKYVAPQVWASRPGRAKTLAKAVDQLLSINVLDAAYFEKEGLPTTFVGNPALARDLGPLDPARFRAFIDAPADAQILMVLPGSRPAEIERLMPPFGETVRRLTADRPDLRVVIPAAGVVAEQVRAQAAGWPGKVVVFEDARLKFDAMAAADVALACSGTVSTELALAGCPMVVAYRFGELTYRLAKLIVRTRFGTLFNIAAGRYVAPEFIQHDCTAENLTQAVAERLDSPDLRRRQVEDQYAALVKMGRGGPNPAEAGAEVVARMLDQRRA